MAAQAEMPSVSALREPATPSGGVTAAAEDTNEPPCELADTETPGSEGEADARDSSLSEVAPSAQGLSGGKRDMPGLAADIDPSVDNLELVLSLEIFSDDDEHIVKVCWSLPRQGH